MLVKGIHKRTLLDRFLKIVLVFFIVLLASSVQGHAAPFSFIVVGDTRTEPYLPSAQIRKRS